MPTKCVEKERHKRQHNKTNTGCVTCRRRRLKCDEAKPSCMRCITLGRTCQGYDVPRAKIFPPQAKCSDENSTLTFFPSITGNALEQRALAFFTERTAPNLAGFTSFTSSFWTFLIPQLSQSEPSVRHIVVALASRYELRSQLTPISQNLSQLCFRHYSMAICALTRSSSPISAEILLVCCIAFIAYERLHNRDLKSTQYLDHFIAGLGILEERSRGSGECGNKNFNLIDSFIEPMFFQIALMFSMFVQPEKLVISCNEHEIQAERPHISVPFGNLKLAQEAFHRICWWRYYLSAHNCTWSSSCAGILSVRDLVLQWFRFLWDYMDSLPLVDKYELRRATALQEQAQLMTGALEMSVRQNVPRPFCCRPVAVELRPRSKISIWIRVDSDRIINLAGINHGRSLALEPGEVWLWPRAKRIRGTDRFDFVTLEIGA
jgi:hypothetical protein